MKPIHLALLALILILGIVNVLASLGVIGGNSGAGSWEYRILSAAEMDLVGFRAVAEDEGLTADEEGKIPLKDFPPEKVVTQAMMARTIIEVENNGGWQFVAVTSSTAVSTAQGQSRSDRYFIFRRPK